MGNLSLGHTCAGTAGYCDVFGKCRAVDAEGPLMRLKNMFLNEANVRTLAEIVKVRDDFTFNFQRNPIRFSTIGGLWF